MLGYLDGIREERTGVNKNGLGLSEGALKSHQTASGINQVMTAAQQKIELIARVFAETGFKDMTVAVYQLVQKYESPEKLVRLNNKWVTMYPADWKEKVDCTAQVGLGFGNKDMNLMHLGQLSQTIQMIAQHPSAGLLLKPKNIYNLVAEQIRAMGMKNIDDFITDPGDQQPQQQQQGPSPEEQAAQVETQLKVEELKLKVQKMQQEASLKQQEMQLDAQMQQQEIDLKKQEAQVNMQIKAQELEIKKADLALKQQELILEREQERPVKIGN
jgi:hypothetical protein